MKHPLRRYRLLYLLALLQLVGGPLVLVGVATLGKVVLKQTAQHGVVTGIASAVQGEDWQAACDLIVAVSADRTDTKAPGGKQKVKDLNPKMISITWDGTLKLPERFVKKEPPGIEPLLLVATWPNGPPSPPPRRV